MNPIATPFLFLMASPGRGMCYLIRLLIRKPTLSPRFACSARRRDTTTACTFSVLAFDAGKKNISSSGFASSGPFQPLSRAGRLQATEILQQPIATFAHRQPKTHICRTQTRRYCRRAAGQAPPHAHSCTAGLRLWTGRERQRWTKCEDRRWNGRRILEEQQKDSRAGWRSV